MEYIYIHYIYIYRFEIWRVGMWRDRDGENRDEQNRDVARSEMWCTAFELSCQVMLGPYMHARTLRTSIEEKHRKSVQNLFHLISSYFHIFFTNHGFQNEHQVYVMRNENALNLGQPCACIL